MYDVFYEGVVTVKIHIADHAFKHGLVTEQIIAAYSTGSATARIRSRDGKADPPRWATIGFDNQARAIEIIFVKTSIGVLIFYANYLTKAFKKELTND